VRDGRRCLCAGIARSADALSLGRTRPARSQVRGGKHARKARGPMEKRGKAVGESTGKKACSAMEERGKAEEWLFLGSFLSSVQERKEGGSFLPILLD